MRTHKLIISLFSGLLCSSFLWLTGCMTLPASQTPVNKEMDWNSRVEALSSIKNWDLKAQIAFRTKKDAQSASLQWHQNDKNYEIMIFGPIGSNTFVLRGSPDQVELANPQGKKFYANTPEALLTEQTGWNLPVSSLYYWIRGLPVPGVAAEKRFDAYHHLTVLTQQGWKIRYMRYTSVNNLDLPSKIILDYPRLNVKIVINEWQAQHPA